MINDRLRLFIEITGFSAVVVSLLLVAMELNQSQNAMEAASMDARNQRIIDNSLLGIEFEISEAMEKIRSGVEISASEYIRLRAFLEAMLRNWETIHFQYTLGVADEEMWVANLQGLENVLNTPWVDVVIPDWKEFTASSTYRASFVELMDTLKR